MEKNSLDKKIEERMKKIKALKNAKKEIEKELKEMEDSAIYTDQKKAKLYTRKVGGERMWSVAVKAIAPKNMERRETYRCLISGRSTAEVGGMITSIISELQELQTKIEEGGESDWIYEN